MKKKVLLAITGSIAAIKVPRLVALLVAKYEVRVIVTDSVQHLGVDLGDLGRSKELSSSSVAQHIALARWADIFVVVPATANTLAKIASGIADNEVCATVFAYDRPLLLVPAMNSVMYHNIEQLGVLDRLADRGHMILGPEQGRLHDGTTGWGRMVEPEAIMHVIDSYFATLPHQKHAIVASGASRVFIDDIRYITNLSSGKMGRLLANALRLQGFTVELLDIGAYTNAAFLSFVAAKKFDLYFSPAAFADYDTTQHSGKLHRGAITHIPLHANIDVLAALRKQKPQARYIAFKHGASLAEAHHKLTTWQLDMVVWTKLGAMGSDTVEAALLWQDGRSETFIGAKRLLARRIAEAATW